MTKSPGQKKPQGGRNYALHKNITFLLEVHKNIAILEKSSNGLAFGDKKVIESPMYTVNWSKKAVKQAAKIPAKERMRIVENAGALTDHENGWNQVKPLKNHRYDYRLRIGNYRVLFTCRETVRIVRIEEVKKRDDRTY